MKVLHSLERKKKEGKLIISFCAQFMLRFDVVRCDGTGAATLKGAQRLQSAWSAGPRQEPSGGGGGPSV